jgi:hypothetical protein
MFTTPDGPDAVRAAVDATLQRNEEHHRNSALPKLGLPTNWVGERQTGASSVHRSFSHSGEELDRSTAVPDQQWEAVELIHGPYPDGPWLAVATSNAPADESASIAAVLREEIEALIPDSAPVWPEIGNLPESEPAKTVPINVRIDAAPVVLRGVTFEGITVARGEWQGLTLTVKSRDWPHDEPVELTRLDDVETYLSGRRQAIEQAMDIG